MQVLAPLTPELCKDQLYIFSVFVFSSVLLLEEKHPKIKIAIKLFQKEIHSLEMTIFQYTVGFWGVWEYAF